MVVSNNTLALPFADGAKIEVGKSDLSGDFAYQALDSSSSFLARLDSARQARQADSAPAPRLPEPEAPQSADAPDAASDADSTQQTASAGDVSADERKAKTRNRPQAAVSNEAIAPPISTTQAAAIPAVLVVAAPIGNAAPPAADSAASTQVAAISPVVTLQTLTTAPISSSIPLPQTPIAPPASTAPLPSGATAAPSAVSASTLQSITANSAPKIQATTEIVAAPTSSGTPVDSRLAALVATPGTETAKTPVPSAVSQTSVLPAPAAQIGTQPTAASPNTAKADTPRAVIHSTVVPQTAASSVVLSATNADAAKPASVSPAAPDKQTAALSTKQTAAATSDQLARLRTVGDTANAPLVPAAKQQTTAPASSQTANEQPADISVNALQSAALTKPDSGAQNVLSAPSAMQANQSSTLISPFDTSASSPVSLPVTVANAALTAGSIAPQNITSIASPAAAGTNQAVVMAQVVSSTAEGRQAQTDGDGESKQDKTSAQNREIGAISAVKSGEASAERLGAANAANISNVANEAASISNETANAPIDRTKLLAQVNQHLETMRLSEGRGEAAFHLNPDSLGSLKIAISTHADGVTARIVAEHAGVRQVLESASEHLRTALENRGLKLHSLEVTTTAGSPADGRGSGNAAQQQQRETHQDRAAFGRSDSRSNRGKSLTDEAPALASAAISAIHNNRVNARLDYRA